MINRLTDITPVTPLDITPSTQPVKGGAGFEDFLRDALTRVENSRQAADQSVEAFVTGENQDLHSTVLATQKASLDFEYLLQVRNKVVQSYQEIMRMQL